MSLYCATGSEQTDFSPDQLKQLLSEALARLGPRSSVLAMPASERPGRNGVTAPIVPERRTTGTTGTSRRSRAGRYSFKLVIRFGTRERSLNCSVMPLPQINHFLSPHCHWRGRNDWNALCITCGSCSGAAESDMKIYLLIMLIGTLLAAVHFTSASEQRSETLPQ